MAAVGAYFNSQTTGSGRRVTIVQENANPKGATVTANVEFQGKAAIKIRYVLTYRDGKIVNEVWQIDPNLSSGY